MSTKDAKPATSLENNGGNKGDTTLRKIPQAHGGALNSGGTPGNKGGTGRPPNDFLAFAAECVHDASNHEVMRTIFKDTEHKHYQSTWKMLAEYTVGRPPQPVVHQGDADKPFVFEVKHIDVPKR